MNRKYILNETGTVVPVEDLMEFYRWFEDIKNRIVRQEYLGLLWAKVKVSTVFLGIDHRWGKGPPVLWETMVFGTVRCGEVIDLGPELDMKRCSGNREQALAMHEEMVRLWHWKWMTRLWRVL